MKKPLDEQLYQNKSIVDLILFCLFSLVKNKKKCNFEALLKECFANFPKVFAFSSCPQWPDARKLDRSLRALRAKKLIKGNPKTLFSLTKSGKEKAKEINRSLGQKRLKI